jgi:hypothetical protein
MNGLTIVIVMAYFFDLGFVFGFSAGFFAIVFPLN